LPKVLTQKGDFKVLVGLKSGEKGDSEERRAGMSETVYMEKLLDGVEVEWVALGTVTQIKTGQPV
jgi:hypothetical protein